MVSALVLAAAVSSADTSFVMAEARRDMTGDGRHERLVLLASGDPTDSLLMEFRIEGRDRALLADSFVVDREIGFDAGRHVADDAEWERVLEFYRGFFADRQFAAIGDFVGQDPPPPLGLPVHLEIVRQVKVQSFETRLIQSGVSPREAERLAQREFSWDMAFDTAKALRQWEEMVSTDVPVFRYSPGGDRLYSLAWSEALDQFVDLLPCC